MIYYLPFSYDLFLIGLVLLFSIAFSIIILATINEKNKIGLYSFFGVIFFQIFLLVATSTFPQFTAANQINNNYYLSKSYIYELRTIESSQKEEYEEEVGGITLVKFRNISKKEEVGFMKVRVKCKIFDSSNSCANRISKKWELIQITESIK